MNKTDSDSGLNRRGLIRAGLSALAGGLLLKFVGANSVTVERVQGANGQSIIIGQSNTGSSTTTLASAVSGPNAFFDNSGTGDAQAIQGRITGTSGRAFVGFAAATSGNTIALDGVNSSPSGIALRGANTATTGDAVGVQGSTLSSTGAAFKASGPGGEVMRVRGDGNVGIGTTAPSSKLSVAGVIESTSIGFKFPDGTTQSTAATGAAAAGRLFGFTNTAGTSLGSSITNYFGIFSGGITSTEANTQIPFPAGTAKNLRVKVTSNSNAGDATFTLRRNTVNTALEVTIPAFATGIFTDTTHTVSIAANDLLDFQFVSVYGGGLYVVTSAVAELG